MEVGRISFTFELLCSDKCQFAFMEGSVRKGVTVLQSWTGPQQKQFYSYLIRRNDSYTFSWAFQKVSWDDSQVWSDSSRMSDREAARIFNVSVTNTIDGGAPNCITCLQGVGGNGCIPCPAGHYIDEASMHCRPCGPDMVVTDPLPYGPESCVSCGPGLTTLDGLTCNVPCDLSLQGQHYDLLNISNARMVKGSTLFTSSGTKYYHVFNISICGDTTVTCTNNVSFSIDETSSSIEARACRSTIVPELEMGNRDWSRVLATQSVSLGDHLLGVSKNSSLHGINVIDEFIFEDSKQLHFFYSTPSSTRACPKGRSTTLTLKCSPEDSGQGHVTLPRQCPDGTCDGCDFHFLWETSLACPVCSAEDMIVVRGECVNGQQSLHYIAPGRCRSTESAVYGSRQEACTAQLPFTVEIVILSALSIAILLCLLLLCLWNKNKRLEYKYMKLVANNNPKDGLMELPPAESCALDDGDDDEVQFAKKPPKPILSKLTNNKIMGKAFGSRSDPIL